jgi:hypothetical protein
VRSHACPQSCPDNDEKEADVSPQAEVDEEIRHIRDLVFIRTLLSSRGATRAELRECDAAIDAARSQLAETAKRAAAYATAA